jgi:transcriptional regulator with XRE-family HTH domain
VELRDLREMSGTTIQQAAKLAGIGFGTMANVERGFHKLSPEQADKLIAAYWRKVSKRLERVAKALGYGRA